MPLKLTEKIAFQQVKMAVLVACGLGILISLAQIAYDYIIRQHELEATLGSIIQTASAPAAEAVWNLDRIGAVRIIEGLFTYPQITEVKLVSDGGEVVATEKKDPLISDFRWATAMLFGVRSEIEIPLYGANPEKQRLVGMMVIYSDPHLDGVAFLKRSVIVLFAGIVKNTLLALLLFLLFYRSLTLPATKLLRFLDSLEFSHPIEKKVNSDDGLYGEFKLLAVELNRLIDSSNSSLLMRDEIQTRINSMNVELEQRVRKRTEEIMALKAKADEANAGKSQFLATMSHEIRTPLDAIVGLSELVKSNPNSPKVSQYMNDIHIASNSLLDVLDDILDFSKAETNELDLNPIPCRLQSLVPELNSVFAQKFEEKGIAFDIEVDPFLPTCVRADPLRFKQIVFNLVSNALKFTFNGQVKVSITLQEENIIDSEAYVLVSVSDTGVGMAPEMVDMLFAPFVNVGEGSESGRPRSTGLGLALSSHLAKLMQGDIRVKSQVGQGTVFTFRAKLPVLEDLSLVSSNEVPLTTQTLAADISNRKILLVDDLEVNRVIVEDFLLSMGMQVDIATDGHEAVEKVRQDNFNLVLMDIHMPVLDGYAATYRIRNELGDRNLPIVALTANAQEQVKEKCLQAGMNDFIAKPVKQDELLEKVLFWTSSPYHAKALASSGAVNTP